MRRSGAYDPPATMQSKRAMWGHAPSPLRGWGYPHPLAGERSGAYDPPETQRTAAGLNSNANTVSAMMPTGIPTSTR
jgi:hypothetical protein